MGKYVIVYCYVNMYNFSFHNFKKQIILQSDKINRLVLQISLKKEKKFYIT